MILANLEIIQTNNTLPEPNYKNLTKVCEVMNHDKQVVWMRYFLVRKTTFLYLDSSLSTINAQCIFAPHLNENDIELFILF